MQTPASDVDCFIVGDAWNREGKIIIGIPSKSSFRNELEMLCCLLKCVLTETRTGA